MDCESNDHPRTPSMAKINPLFCLPELRRGCLTAGRASAKSCGEGTRSAKRTPPAELDAGFDYAANCRGRTFALENADRKQEPGSPSPRIRHGRTRSRHRRRLCSGGSLMLVGAITASEVGTLLTQANQPDGPRRPIAWFTFRRKERVGRYVLRAERLGWPTRRCNWPRGNSVEGPGLDAVVGRRGCRA